MHDIFLSYSTVDRERLLPLVVALEQQGWSVFWDHRSVPIGKDWREVIEEAVCQCRCVLVVWSEDSVKSKWVKEEATEGGNRKVLLPIRVDNVSPPFGFRETQAGDFIGWNGGVDYPEFIRLAGEIRTLLEKSDAEQERLAKEKAAADQKNREAAEHQRWLNESQARLAEEEAVKQKKLAQERAAAQKAREEAERQAKAKQEQLKREQATINDRVPPDKKFPLIPALLLSTAVLGGGGYYWKSSVHQSKPVEEESLVGQAPTVVSPASVVPEPDMVDIPAGTFTMGCVESRDVVEGMDKCYDSEKPAHEVTLNAFKMAKTEVTFDQWDACEKAKACPHAEDQGWGRGNRPVINVSWDDITQKYIPWLSQETGKHYRLPTEAEWEYAARGGADTAYPWGNAIGKGNANCDNSSCGDKFEYTAPVGSFAANGYGLNDMNGNVWEWVEDSWHSDYKGAPADGSAWESGGSASGVLRGGSWYGGAQDVRSANRSDGTPDNRYYGIGFRLASGQ